MEEPVLVDQILGGNHQAMRQLIDQYQRLVLHTVARLVDNERDKEEVCQDVFVKVFQNLHGFQFESRLSTWIATIAYRTSINYLKKKKRLVREDDLDRISFQVGQTDSSVEDRDYASFINQLIRQMPENYRVVLTLYHLDGFSYPEIVEITDMPEGTVKNYLFRARKKLRELTEPYIGKEIHLN